MSTKILLSGIVFFLICLAGCGQEVQESYQDKVKLSYSEDVSDPESIWPDRDLKDRFTAYWYKHFSGDLDGLWNLEAPHFRFMANRSQYNNYHAMALAQMPIHIEIKDIEGMSEYLHAISFILTLTRSGQKKSVDMTEYWVRVDGGWHHVLRNPFVFPFTN